MPELAYVNDRFCPISEAVISIEDRGYQFADGIYEVVVFYGHRPFMLEEHLERLYHSAAEIDLEVDKAGLDLRKIMQAGVERAGFDETMVYLQVTRGVEPRNHIYSTACTPTVVMTFKPKPVVSDDVRRRGLSVRTVDDFRWGMCHTKSLVLLPSVIAKNRALRDGYDDILWVGPGAVVREAAAANVFIINDACVITPPQDTSILHGITRKWVLGSAAKIDLPQREEPITRQQLVRADEVFVSSTTVDVMPVTRVDDQAIGDGKPGHWSTALYEHMQAHVERLKTTEVA